MPATGDTISVLCACGKKLKAPASAVGRRAKCPSCANVLTIELPPPPPDIPEVADDDPLGAMYDLAETEKAAAKSNQLDDSPRCPKCAASMQAGAVLCTSCGFDTRSNKKVGAAPIARPVIDYAKPVKKKRDKMAPDGSFLIGLLASFGGALLGGFVWFLVTWGTGIDFYIVCMLIGIGAGVGMQIGQRGFSTLGGYAAAGMTLVVLMLARLAVIIAILLPMIRRGAIHFPSPHSGAAQAQTPSGQTAASDDSDDDETATASNSSQNASAPTARSSSFSSSSTASAHRPNASAAIGALVILLLFFGWKGIVFTLLTLFMAYRTASGSVSG